MENKLEIILEAVNNASVEIKKVQGQIKGLSGETERTTDDTKRHTQTQIKQWAKVGLAIFGVYGILRQLGTFFKTSINLAAVHNREYIRSLVEFETSVNRLKQAVGERLLPVLKTTFEYWTKIIDGIGSKNATLSAGQKQLIKELERITELQNNEPAVRASLEQRTGKIATGVDVEIEQKRLNDARMALIANLHSYEKQAELEKISVIKQINDEYLTGSFARTMLSEQDKINQMKVMWAMYHSDKLNSMMAEQQRETEFMQFALNNQKMAHQSMWTLAGKSRDIFISGTTAGLMGIIQGTMSAKEAAKQMGFQMVEAVIQFTIQKLISSVISKALLVGEVASATAAGSAVALAWSDAAAMVSLATLGTNAIPASAGITATVGLAKALALPGLAEGGIVNRPTIALIGESGPEAVVPLSKQGGRMGQYINIEINSPVFRSHEDIDYMTEEISRRLAHEAERLN